MNSEYKIKIYLIALFTSTLFFSIDSFGAKKCSESFDEDDNEPKNENTEAEEKKLAPAKVASFVLSFYEKNSRMPEEDDFLLKFHDYDSWEYQWTVEEVVEQHPKRFEEARQKVRTRIIRAYKKYASERGRTLSEEEFATLMHADQNVIKQWFHPELLNGAFFRDPQDLVRQAEKEHPKSFAKIINLHRFTPAKNLSLIENVRNKSRIISSSVFAGVEVNKDFWAALQNYQTAQDATTLLNPVNYVTLDIPDSIVESSHIVTHTVDLGPDLWIHNMKILGKMRNSLLGFSRFGKRGKSIVIGSPQMRVEQIPTLQNVVCPHKCITNGTVSQVRFAGAKYVEDRLDKMVEYDVTKGALILEKAVARSPLTGQLIGAGSYHMRHVEFIPERKGFWDLGKFYTANSVTVERPEALSLGDAHIGVDDPKLLSALAEQVLAPMQPKTIVLHDLFNGDEISEWEREKPLQRAMRFKHSNLNLEKAFAAQVHFLNLILDICPKTTVYVVRANHNDWLERYLTKGTYLHEPHNYFLAHELIVAMGNGWDPLQYALAERQAPNPRVTFPKRVVFLKPGEQLNIGPAHRSVNLSTHGHIGANGAKGGKKSLKEAADRMVYGHTHTYYRDGGTVNIGTSTVIPASYGKEGASNNNQSLALITSDGAIQVLEYRDGRWYTDPELLPIAPEEFFPEDYPYVLPNNSDIITPGGTGQFSQYNPR